MSNCQDNNSIILGLKQGQSIAEVVSFFTQLRSPPWLLIAINPDEQSKDRIKAITAYGSAEIDTFVSKYNGVFNLYYSLNPTRTDMARKPTKADIAAIEYLQIDADPNDGETPEDAKKRYLDQFANGFEPKPTALIDSGNGIQGLCKLVPRIELPPTIIKDGKPALSDEAVKIIADAEARSETMMLRLGTKAGTQNIDRILRIPGTINLPTAAKLKRGRVPCPTKLLAFNGVSYPLDSFPLHAAEEPSGSGTTDDQVQQPLNGEDKLERVIANGSGGDFESRSHAVWWTINEMLRRGYTDRSIVSTLMDRANKISEHVLEQRNPRHYVERQIKEARAKLPPPKPIEVLPPSQWFGEKSAPVPPALIKGILPQTGVATIGGQSGGGKSSHAIHIATCLMPDCKQDVYIDRYKIKRKGGVLYLVLEGKPSFLLRVTGAFRAALGQQMKLGDPSRHPFSWNTYAPNLFEKGPDALLKLAERDAARMRQEFGVDLVAIFLDTMGLAACYENEDRSAQVQRVVSGLNRLSDVTGALAINVDHMGKDQDAGLRGTSAKRDCVETILTCLIDRDKHTNKAINHRMQLFKIRDGEEGRVIPYKLKTVDFGVDEDGDPITTNVVEWEPNRVAPAPR
jgi:hypothetical protein